ncbi:MAG: recombinase family protein, partial [Bifidobacteriaceae bacterium]|jgi:hypothetical protein|nr:recombinase family protein [Bifidobacteriaceae bacterium]
MTKTRSSTKGVVGNTKQTRQPIAAVSYLRTACVEQAQRDRLTDNPAIAAQRRACDAKIAAIGAVKVGEFVSLGERAEPGERASWQDMMDFARRHGASCVAVDSLSRFSRDGLQAAALVRQLRVYDMELVSAREELDDPLLRKLMEAMEYFGSGRWRSRPGGQTAKQHLAVGTDRDKACACRESDSKQSGTILSKSYRSRP